MLNIKLTRRTMLGQISAAGTAAWRCGAARTGGSRALSGQFRCAARRLRLPRARVRRPGEIPFAAQRGYTPPPASVEELLQLQRDLHMERVVVVQPSVYGTDNACTLDGVSRWARARAPSR